MLKRSLIALFSLALLASAAYGQAFFPNTVDRSAVPGTVPMCLNSSAQAVPCTDATALQSAHVSVVSFARTADTNAYTANDVLGTGTGSAGASLEFDNIGKAAGGETFITTVQLEIDITAIPSGMTSFRLYLYSVTPPSALGDNAAWDLPSGDRASYKGYVDLGSPVDLGSTLYVETTGINKQVTVPSGGKLFGYLVTNGGYTPGSGSVYNITLHSTDP